MPFFRKSHNSCPWSLAEKEWLEKNKTLPLSQLTIALNRSNTSVKAMLSGKEEQPKKKSGKKSNIGRRKDCGNIFFRSGWEANIYRWLKTLPNIKSIQ
jgi:hypothetical protein